MEAHKLQIKFFMKPNGASFEFEPFIAVLHEWIRQRALDELLIDVADYSHVHEGPGLLLVGHAADYYIDLGEGRPGLLYSRKREAPDDPVERVEDAIRRALVACKKLEDEDALDVHFSGEELVFRLNDRLRAPNAQKTFDDVRPALETVLKKVYGDTSFTTERVGGERELFTVRVKAPGAPPARELLQRLA